MRTGAWAALKSIGNGQWKVDGGAVRLAFFFEEVTPKLGAELLDPARWRYIWCRDGVMVGPVVTLSADGKRIVWPKTVAR